jgi:tetratricopeptide (TPR) repeat protein
MADNKNRSAEIDKLWDYDKPDESEKRFRTLLPEAEKSGDAGYRVEVLTQIARTMSLRRRFDEAHKILDEAETLLSPNTKRASVRVKLERGRTFNSAGNPDKARPLFLSAWELAQIAKEDYYSVDAAHMMGIIEPPEKAVEWNLKALDLAEKSSDVRARNWRGSLYNNLGWTYHDRGKYTEALDLFEKALKVREEQKKPQPIRIAKYCVGRALRSLSRIDDALKIQQALHEEYESIHTVGAYVEEEMGECLVLLHRPDEAQKHFAAAYRELSKDQWLVEHEPARIKRLKEFGRDP